MKSFVVALVGAGVVAFASPVHGLNLTLEFDAPVPGTIADANGLGTGFTDRLTGTGGLIPANDPNLDLVSSPGKLLLTSVRSDFNHGNGLGRNLDQLEAPGFFLPGVGSRDLAISAVFENVAVPNLSDQLLLYAAVDENTILRAGVHEGNVYHFTINMGAGDSTPLLSPPNSFATGDDIQLTLARTGGLWSISWLNLSDNKQGVLGLSLPWLDASGDLYLGVHAANARSNTSFVAEIDRVTVNVVPEPQAIGLALIGAAAFVAARRRFGTLLGD